MSTSTATEAERKLAVMAMTIFNAAELQAERHQVFGNTIRIGIPGTFSPEVTHEKLGELLNELTSTWVRFDGITLNEKPTATFTCIKQT